MGAEMDTVKIAPYYYYEPLKLGYRNLSDLLGTDEHYIWVKIDFSITDDLKNKSLGFVVPSLFRTDLDKRCLFRSDGNNR